jgi:hypothetical protein
LNPGQNPPDFSEAELFALIGAVMNDAATAAEKQRLNDVLLRDPASRRMFRRYINLHATLHSRFALPEQKRGSSLDREASASSRRDIHSFVWRMGRVAAVLAVAVAACWGCFQLFGTHKEVVLIQPGNSQHTEPAHVAVPLAHISKSSGARWGRTGAILPLGSAFKPGPVVLSEGLAEITFRNGVRMVLEAPVEFTLRDANEASLQSGRLVTYVPPEARGFSIETPHSRVVDLGTEFGVGVNSGGETEVQVFRGEVLTRIKSPKGPQIEQHWLAGNAVNIDISETARGIPFQPQHFVRMFPADKNRIEPGGPLYNRSCYDAVHVVPAPAKPVIDGDLSDWDRSGTFHGACVPPYGESHYVDGSMMYDANFLYIAAHVGDPAPMLSQMTPDADPQHYSWRGGSVIVRLATDPALGWPLKGLGNAEKTSAHPEYGSRPEDVSKNIVHLTMWYNHPTGKARLQVSYGMDFHGELLNPEGWQGVFRKDANGLGYTLEYAIPWTLLNAAARPPQAGDELAANWVVHWSDEKGALSQGHLVEITNPAVQPFRFLRGQSWGKAIFHKEGHLLPAVVAPVMRPTEH